jgi:hypothetical protein
MPGGVRGGRREASPYSIRQVMIVIRQHEQRPVWAGLAQGQGNSRQVAGVQGHGNRHVHCPVPCGGRCVAFRDADGLAWRPAPQDVEGADLLRAL